jgi:hypothetical protein
MHIEMKSIRIVFPFIIGFLTLASCRAQPEQNVQNKQDRPPAVAGSFYPSSETELIRMLENAFGTTKKIEEKNPLAIIVPHAGYIYSGNVAAAGFRQIDRKSRFEHIFLLGSSHTMYFNGAAVYDQGDFITPLGKVKVDTLARWLTMNYKVFDSNPKPHLKEHSLEVQLPFLQYWLEQDFSIVPIILGGEDRETCRKVAEALRPFFNSKNLFIISTDFSHYPDYQDAQYSDNKLAEAVITNSARHFLDVKNELETSNISNLATAMCGWTSVYSLMLITQDQEELNYKKIRYQNSGDTPYGDKDRVVGYCAIAVFRDRQSANSYNLSTEDKITLLKIARNTLTSYIPDKKEPPISLDKLPESLKKPAGAFVTLKQNHDLRGCIGHFEADNPLYLIVEKMAIAAATEDPRFYPVKKEEIPGLEIEISVLTPLKKIENIDEIELGKHGIYIKKGYRAGTFLPQVATGTGWNKEEYLGHCARDKAGIGWDGWKTADIYIYEALVFSEHEFKL